MADMRQTTATGEPSAVYVDPGSGIVGSLGVLRVAEGPEHTAGEQREPSETDTVATAPAVSRPQYQPNPKHKPLPTPGRHGSICPQNVDAQALLSESHLYGEKRYATDGSAAFCAQCHDADRNLWHGYPVSWAEVPPRIRQMWVGTGKVMRRTIRHDRRRRS